MIQVRAVAGVTALAIAECRSGAKSLLSALLSPVGWPQAAAEMRHLLLKALRSSMAEARRYQTFAEMKQSAPGHHFALRARPLRADPGEASGPRQLSRCEDGLPPPEAGTTLVQLFDRVLWLMAAGEITIDEASRIARLIADWRPQVEAVSVATASTAEAADRPAASRATHAAAARPAFDLQTAGKGAAAPVPDDAPPLNRHDRRRAAVLARTARAPTPDPTRLTAAA